MSLCFFRGRDGNAIDLLIKRGEVLYPFEIKIKEVPSSRRNPIISEIVHRLGFVERRGSSSRKSKTKPLICMDTLTKSPTPADGQ